MQQIIRAFPLSIFLLTACVPISQQYPAASGETAAGIQPASAIQFTDAVYDPNVKSVICYAQTGQPNEVLNPPVIQITQEQPLVLEFDQLNTPQQRFVARLIYCNADWTEARVTQSQYLQEYNEFYLTDVSPSFNTKVPFFHYRFKVPAVKLSGNYLLVVSDANGRPVITRRVLIFEKRLAIGAQPALTAGGNARFTNQQIDFQINYNQYPLVNPSQELTVVLRQNFRWDNAKFNLRPQFVREAEKRLEFTFFDLQHTFPGSNEFRFFDNRSRRYLGANLATANREAVPEEILLVPEPERARQAFSQQIDINGKFIFGNREFGNEAVNADYQYVTFQLAAPRPVAGEVYAFGEMTNWALLPEFKMTYLPEKQLYQGRALLKQGYYNYLFAVQPNFQAAPDETLLEGSFQNTENNYDILVYYRPPGTRSDLLIGYERVAYNGRN